MGLTFGLFIFASQPAFAQSNVQGQWQVLPYLMPVNPIHLALMNNGLVLVIAGSGNDPANQDLEAAVWDPIAGTINSQSLSWDMLCNGIVNLWNGKELIAGGTLQYSPFLRFVKRIDLRSFQQHFRERAEYGSWALVPYTNGAQ
jgi:hypothetical protein